MDISTASPATRADGSAVSSAYGFTVLGAVNGPNEVQRRDELPEEAAIEVLVRPAVGVGSIRERYFEEIISATLRSVINVRRHPRTLIQITLQVTKTPAGSGSLIQADPVSRAGFLQPFSSVARLIKMIPRISPSYLPSSTSRPFRY